MVVSEYRKKDRLSMDSCLLSPLFSTQVKQILMLLICLIAFGCNNSSDIPVIDFTKTVPHKKAVTDNTTPELKVAVAAMVSPEDTFLAYNRLLRYIARETGHKVTFVQRKTYREVNQLLSKGTIDLAFICSGPYAIYKNKAGFDLIAAPIVRGSPFYRAYLIVNKDSPITSLSGLKGKVFAFTDPESNTGRLVPLYWLYNMGERPQSFFRKSIFTYSHSNSLLAVSRHLVDGASVDGLVWDYYSLKDPKRVIQTKVIRRSRPFGNPPIVVSRAMSESLRNRISKVIYSMDEDKEGRNILTEIMVDKFVRPKEDWYEPIREMAGLLAQGQGVGHVSENP